MEEYKYNEEDLDLFMKEALKLVDQAGDLIRSALTKGKNVSLKDAATDKEGNFEGNASAVLTETDKAVETHIVSGLKALFPDHKFIGEEDISDSNDGGIIKEYSNNPTWIIDPIDGTMNFVHSNPLVCTSVGLAINRKVVLGIVNCPITHQLFTAIKGRGAFLNSNTPLRTSGIKSLKNAMIAMEFPAGANAKKREGAVANVSTLLTKIHALRAPGPAAMDIAWVGSGSLDVFFHFSIHCWDMAAGALIVQEAGGYVMRPDGSEFDLMGRSIVAAASEELAREIGPLLNVYPASPEFKEVCPI